jgi:transposase
MRQINTLGIDTAKHVFQLHGVDQQGHVVLHKRVSRKQVLPLLAQLPPCLVGLEACGGSHSWAREITKLGHTVKLMAPQAVLYSGKFIPRLVIPKEDEPLRGAL